MIARTTSSGISFTPDLKGNDRTLRLSYRSLTAHDVDTVFEYLQKHPELNQLSITSCTFATDDALIRFQKHMSGCKVLRLEIREMESLCLEQLQESGLQTPILNILANNKNLSHLLVSGCSNVFQPLLFHPALKKLRTVQMENIEVGMTAIKTLAEIMGKNIFQKIILKNVALRVDIADVEQCKQLLAANLNTAWNNLHLDNVFFGSHASLYDRHPITTKDIRGYRFLSKSSPVFSPFASPLPQAFDTCLERKGDEAAKSAYVPVQPPGGSAPGDVKSARPAKSTPKESKLNWITNGIKKADTKPLHPISPLTPFTQREKAKLPKGVFFKALEKSPTKLKPQKTTKFVAPKPARIAVITQKRRFSQ